MLKRTSKITFLSLAVLLSAATSSYAQQSGEETQSALGETVETRAKDTGRSRERGPDTQKLPDTDKRQNTMLGDFSINPAISVSEYYDDNIFYTRETPDEDFITVIAPSLSLSSNWDKHELNLHGGATIGRYQQHENEDYEDYFAGFDGHVDLAPKSRFFGGVQWNRLHEGRESPDDVLGLHPTEYDMLDLFFGGQHEFKKIGMKFGITAQNYNFDDVVASSGTINNDDRDRQEFEFGGRLVFPWKKQVRPFIQGVFGKRLYDDPVDDAGYDRDSSGYGLATGLLVNPKKNLSIEILAGLLHQDYDDPSLSNARLPDLGALVSWRPSPYTNVDFSLDRRIRETTLAGASGYVSTASDISIHRDLTQTLSLGAGTRYTENDYIGLERTDNLISINMDSRYYLTSNIYSGLGYQFLHRDSDLAGQDFYDNQIMLRLGAQLKQNKPPAGLPSGIDNQGSFFAGVHEGHGSVFAALDGPRGAGGTVTADFGDHGGVTGLFAGYDHFFGRWFIGAEAGIEKGTGFDWEHIESGDRIFKVSRKESYNFALRAGYRQPDNIAYYGHAGPLWTGFDTAYSNGGNLYTRDESELGFQFGGGVEAPLTGTSGFIRMDYSYATYEDYGINWDGGTDYFDNSEALMRLGLVFRSGIKKAQTTYSHDFSGPYIGVQVGYGGFAARNIGPRNAGSTLAVDRSSHGGTGGVFAGYGFTPLGKIYLGAELGAEESYADWNIFRDPTGRIYDAQKDWSVEAALRIGYILNDSVLVYGRTGGVLTRFDTDYTRGAQDVSQNDDLQGLRYGGGIEVEASSRMFVRMDYSYTDYDAYRVNYTTGIDRFSPTETLIRFGIGYRF